jgi:dTDP-4-amino-4,6-dideoxygalactose transaminase
VRSVDDTYRHGLGRDGACLIEALGEGLSGTGRLVAAYESATAEQFGAAHAIAVASGSAAVLAALAGLRLPRGGKVVVSPLAPLCTVYPIMALGLEPVFCDTNAADFGLCVPDLERILTPEIAAVVEVPMWGYPVPADEVAAVCARRGVPYVLDLAHGHRIRLHGRDLSRYGLLATFSTHEGKILSTGEGGMVLTDDAALAQAVRSYTRFGDLDGRSFGINLKLSGVQAALGARRMRGFARDLAERRRKAELFFAHLDSEQVTPWPICPGGEPNYYAILVEVRGAAPHAVIEAIGAAGVPSDKLKYPCQVLYRFELLEPHARPCPNAEALIARLSTVPVHPDLEDGELIEMARIINQVTASRRDPHETKQP